MSESARICDKKERKLRRKRRRSSIKMRGRAVSDDLRGRVRAATRTLSIEGRKEKKDKTRRKKKKKKKKKKTSRSGDDEGEKKAKKDEKRRKEERRRLIIEKKKKKKEKTGRDRQEEGRTRGGSEEGESSAFRRGGEAPFLGAGRLSARSEPGSLVKRRRAIKQHPASHGKSPTRCGPGHRE
ncbi:hypothetical protein HL42_6763 [Trichophyton rubrum]|nr:hypothetical protein HL42_6763 [Trichophyton rubrum]